MHAWVSKSSETHKTVIYNTRIVHNSLSLTLGCVQLLMWSNLIRFSMRWFSPPPWEGEVVGEAGERREGIGGEEGGVQAEEGAQEGKQELWGAGLHGAQAGASVMGGEG